MASSKSARVKRRAFLGAVGAVGSLGALGYARRSPVDSIDVRFWISERADAYAGVADRVREYLARALDLDFWSANVSYGGVVSVGSEDGYDVTVGGEWPRAILGGTLGAGDVEPVSDVNLLVTDGPMDAAPTGVGIPHVASVGGARHLASLPPVDERPEVVPYRTRDRVMQVLVHEVGHALGLDHDHGVAVRRGDAVVVTPMLSSYAWSPEYDGVRSRCGTEYPDVDGLERRLTYTFSRCARRRLRRYRGGFTP